MRPCPGLFLLQFNTMSGQWCTADLSVLDLFYVDKTPCLIRRKMSCYQTEGKQTSKLQFTMMNMVKAG